MYGALKKMLQLLTARGNSPLSSLLCLTLLPAVLMTKAIPAQTDATQVLAERFAPELMHPHDEPNLPTSVDWFVQKTSMSFRNIECQKDNTDFGAASFSLLSNASLTSSCDKHVFTASGTWSASRKKTFILSDVADRFKKGSTDPAEWNTYFHAFRNNVGGWSIQYWSFYPYNTGKKLGPIEIGYHGGDWEMVEVVLDPQDNPVSLHSTGHTNIEVVAWSAVEKNGTHPVLYTEKGGHEAHSTAQEPPPYIVHPTWSQGLAILPNLPPKPVGKLLDLGTKLKPREPFLLYSGLWGSLGSTPISSGYWGPAFNETGMKQDNFLAAWCDGIDNPDQTNNGKRECYPDDPQ